MKTKLRVAIVSAILTTSLLSLPAPSLAAVAFTVNGVVTQASSTLYYNSQGQPSIMTFTIDDEDHQSQTIICRRPYLGVCTFVDSSVVGKKVHVTGYLEMFSWSDQWQLSAESTSLVY
jgi:hypothetical protein